MAYIKCIEPNMQNVTDYVVTATANDTIELPAVDSCMGVIFIKDDFSMVAGHIGMFGYGPTADNVGDGCTKIIVEEMLRRVHNPKDIKRVIVVTDIAQGDLGMGYPADPSYFNPSDPSRLILAQGGGPLLVTKIAKGGKCVDVVVVGMASFLHIYQTKGKQLLYSKPFNLLPVGGVTRY
ncbi:hypothetical protein PITCH_A1070002 [uncultured Desulfobacterium sp.]|uniref:Uncharacterized protein n=1 Tax=uncultured Desulfobacterium sp. TaxID=201089 RepID=A0A445MQW1_9BACT|nr:hypothetical protein PITCH_A1070002 [uncultured Desulfobacterium sp.]